MKKLLVTIALLFSASAMAVLPPRPEPENIPFNAGWGEVRLSLAAKGPGKGGGKERLKILPNGRSYKDLIINPDGSDGWHEHTGFGNTCWATAKNLAELKACPKSTASGGRAWINAYWAPSLFYVDPQGKSHYVKPAQMLPYYLNNAPDAYRKDVHALPDGLQLIAGNAKQVGPYADKRAAPTYVCEGGFKNGIASTSGKFGGCSTFKVELLAPNCLKVDAAGKPVIKSADLSHYAYSGIPNRNGNGPNGCPLTHPYRIMQIFMLEGIQLRQEQVGHVYWSSDNMDDPGKTYHFDVIAVKNDAPMLPFKQSVSEVIDYLLLNNCIYPRVECGVNGLGELFGKFYELETIR